jgi:parvulin-like peptidyl-prolyl isomerase
MPALLRVLPVLPFLILLGTASLASGQSSDNGIAAVVNGRVITRSEVRDAVRAQQQMLMVQFHDDPSALKREMENLQATALDSLIDRELILAEFKHMGASLKSQWIDDDVNNFVRENFKGDRDAFVKELAKNNMTVKKFREMREKMMIVQAMRGRQAGQQSPATPREVKEFYEKNVSKWRQGDMIKISTITIPKFTGDGKTTTDSQRKLAEEVRRKLAKGADFAATAKAYSQDSHAEDGGAWDWMAKDQMKPSIANVAFSLRTGGVSDVIDDEAAYVIIACDAIKYGDAPSMDKVRPEIEKMISSEKSKAIVDKWMEELRRKATIKKYGW